MSDTEQITKKRRLVDAHDSFYVWSVLKARWFQSALPALKGSRTNSDILAMVAMIFLAGFGGTFAGFYYNTNAPTAWGGHPPTQYTGVCIPPLVITQNGCFRNVAVTTQVNGQTQTTNTQVPAGYLILGNSTQGSAVSSP